MDYFLRTHRDDKEVKFDRPTEMKTTDDVINENMGHVDNS